jgi:hypothetical protein
MSGMKTTNWTANIDFDNWVDGYWDEVEREELEREGLMY